MNRAIFVIAVLVVLALGTSAQRGGFGHVDTSAPPLPKNDAEKRVLATLDDIVKNHQTYLSVPMQDGRMLRVLAEAVDAKNVVEIGTSTGYSGLWFCLALQNTGGRLTTFEIDHGRAAMAREHFAQAGVEKIVTVIEGDAHEKIATLKGPIDVVFIDADKEGYVDYLKNSCLWYGRAD